MSNHIKLETIKEDFFNGNTRLDVANKYDKYYSNVVWHRLQQLCDTHKKIVIGLVTPEYLKIGDYYISGSSFASNPDFILIYKVIDIKKNALDAEGNEIGKTIVYTTSSNCLADTIAGRVYDKGETKTVLKLNIESTNDIYFERVKRKLFVLRLFYEEALATDTSNFNLEEELCHKHKCENIAEEIRVIHNYIELQDKVNEEIIF